MGPRIARGWTATLRGCARVLSPLSTCAADSATGSGPLAAPPACRAARACLAAASSLRRAIYAYVVDEPLQVVSELPRQPCSTTQSVFLSL